MKDKLTAEARAAEKQWLKHMGKLKHLRKETECINRLIEKEFERIDPEICR